jgi:hypothetical protein
MKRIDSPNDDTVALEMSREEFHALRDALLGTVSQLEDSTLKRRQLMCRLEGADEEQVCERLAAEEWISEDSVED